jgi:hypothetical protein
MNNTVTQEQVDGIFNASTFSIDTVLDKCTVVSVQLPNGFIIVESSACVDPVNYNEQLGADICIQRIKNKIWELEGYKLQSELSSTPR